MQNPRGCWRQCIAAALALFCTLGLNINAFSVYIPYLSDLLELTPNQNSYFLLVRNLLSVGGVFLAKAYYKKLDVRLGFSLSLALSVLSVFLYARVDNFYELCAVAMMSGLSYGLGSLFPVAILIHRWFPKHESVAMGICAACSGLATAVGAPLITAMVEKHSIAYAMYCETIFLVIALVFCMILIRNYPDEVLDFKEVERENKRERLQLNWMFFAVVVLGMLSGAFNYLTIHYTTEGFHPYQISSIVSVIGLVLTLSKVVLGGILSWWGTYRTNWVFLSITILGCFLFSIGGSAGYTVAMIAGCLFAIGDAIATVGVTAYARDLSKLENYAATQQQYQTATMLGGLVCMLIPGFVASLTGSYRGFYVIITILMLLATAVIQISYVKKNK